MNQLEVLGLGDPRHGGHEIDFVSHYVLADGCTSNAACTFHHALLIKACDQIKFDGVIFSLEFLVLFTQDPSLFSQLAHPVDKRTQGNYSFVHSFLHHEQIVSHTLT